MAGSSGGGSFAFSGADMMVVILEATNKLTPVGIPTKLRRRYVRNVQQLRNYRKKNSRAVSQLHICEMNQVHLKIFSVKQTPHKSTTHFP